MKHLVNYINESIFGDNINSAIKINGVNIYEPEWKLCEKFFEKRRKKYFGNKSTITLGDTMVEHTVLYNEDDCIICENNEETDYDEIYILCPETIYMNYQTDKCCTNRNYRNYQFSLNNIDDANDYDISFTYYSDTDDWAWLTGCHSLGGRKIAMDEIGICKGYIPETISKKAKDVIKKYTK